MQTIFRKLTGNAETPLITVHSIIIIAELINPLHARVQRFSDRLFYRARYNAIQVLNRFTEKVRDEMNLDVLSADLLRVLDETMQPAHSTLWLRQPAALSKGCLGYD